MPLSSLRTMAISSRGDLLFKIGSPPICLTEKDYLVCSGRSQRGGRNRSRNMYSACERGVHHYCCENNIVKRSRHNKKI
uniref:Uncharacterized protein n=1 Tax=Arion vulgaris TaxID=1028688 RepID=A0A0B7BFQ5_9EUPU